MSGVIQATNLQTTNIKSATGNTGATIASNGDMTMSASRKLYAPGHIVQAVQPAKLVEDTTGDTRPSGNATWTDTGLTAAITPSSSSSKVLIFCNGLFHLRRNEEIRFRFMRDSTAILTMCGYAETSDGFFTMTAPSGYMDSPSTTSSTTYKLQFYAQSEYASLRFNYSGTSSLGEASITLLEVAG